MRFYTRQHRHDCGVDLHVKTMYLCILDSTGQVVLHRNVRSSPEGFLAAVAPYRDDLVVAAECRFTWYWLADLCAAEAIPFVLGHALAMKAMHGGKAKNDRLDSQQIAALLRGVSCPRRTSTRRRCAPRAISSGVGCTSCGSAANSWRASRTPARSTTCPGSRDVSLTPRIVPGSARTSPTPACARALTWTLPSESAMTIS